MADAIAPPVLIFMLEDANKRLELLRSKIRVVKLMLVGPPRAARIGMVPNGLMANGGDEIKMDREGLEIYYEYDVDDLLKDKGGDDWEGWESSVYPMYNDGCFYAAAELQSLQLRFGDFFVTDLVPDGLLNHLRFTWIGANENDEVTVHFQHRTNLGLGETNDDQIIVILNLYREKPGGGPDINSEFVFKTGDLANLVGIPMESLRDEAVEAEFDGVFKLPQLACVPMSTLEEKLGGHLVFETFKIIIPQRAVWHKCHML